MYYVREGQVNNYAMNFIVPVPANMREICFTWQSLAGRPLPYSINVISSDQAILPRPSLNISHIGEIPTAVQTFAIGLNCSGTQAGEVDVTIGIEVILNRAMKNVTRLVFRRKKMCSLSQTRDDDPLQLDDPLLLETVIPPPTGLLTLMVGGILAFALVMLLLIAAFCVRGSVKRQNGHGHAMRTSSFQRLNPNGASCPLTTASFIKPPISANHLGGVSTAHKLEPQKPEELHRRISELTVERCRVRLSNLLQEGTYGRVYRGTYNDTQDVLVKTVAQHASQMQVSLLLQEGMSLYGASHPGILSVLGVSIEDHTTPFVLYPATNNTRNLKLFLLEPACARTITTIQIVQMCTHLSNALAHLHSHSVVHKDIAVRNCV